MPISATSDDFNTDMQTLEKDVQEYEAAMQKKVKDDQVYQNEILEKLKQLKSPDEILMYLAMYVFASQETDTDSNILGLMDDQIGILGKSLLSMSGLTKVGNDLEDMTNYRAGTPDDLKAYAQHLDDLIDRLKDPNSSLSKLLDPTVKDSLLAQYTTLRHDVFIQGDDQHNGPPGSAHLNPNAKSPFLQDGSLDPNAIDPATGKLKPPYGISSFGDLQKLMGIPGNLGGANDAAKLKTDSFNTITSTTQSANAALNQQVTQETNDQKTILSFYVNLLHEPMDIIKQAVKNQAG